MKEESQPPPTDPELEARIVALVLGEASDFEREELNRLIEERPSLAAFKREIEDVHGLLRDVATGESVAEDDDWKLPAAKRSEVLAAIDGAEEEQPIYRVVNKPPPEEPRLTRRSLFWNLTKIAAVLCLAVILGSLTFPEWFVGGRKGSPRNRPLGLARHDYHETDSREKFRDQWFVTDEASPSRTRLLMSDGSATITADDENLWVEKSTADVGLDHGRDSQTALSAIQDTLDINGVLASPSSPPTSTPSRAAVLLDADGVLPSPHYLQDDVQYFSRGAEFGLSRNADTPSEPRGGEELSRAPAGRFIFGTGVNGEAGVTGTIVIEERNFDIESFGDGDRLAGSQPSVPNTGNGDLSFPTYSFVSPESTVSVPDGGTVLLGGVKRREVGKSERKAWDAPTVSSPKTSSDYRDFERGQETLDAAGSRLAGLGDRPAPPRVSERSPEFAGQGLGSAGSGQGQNFSKGQSRLRGDREFGNSNDSEDSLVDGKDWEMDDSVTAGQDAGSRQFGSYWSAPTNEPGESNKSGEAASTEHKPDDVAKGVSNAWRKAGETAETAPAVPMIVGTGGMVGGGARGSGASDSSRYEAFESESLDTVKLRSSLPTPGEKPMSPTEEFKSQEDLAVIEKHKEEATKESVITSRDDGLAIRDSRGLGRSPSLSIQTPASGITARTVVSPDRRYLRIDVPTPMAGTPIGEPPSVLEGEPSKQDMSWGYRGRDSGAYSGGDDQASKGKRSLTFSVEDADRQSKLADLAERFNELLEEDRFEEAEVIAKQSHELEPESEVARNMLATSKFAWRLREQESIADSRERGFYDAMTSVEGSGVPFDDTIHMQFEDRGKSPSLTGMVEDADQPEIITRDETEIRARESLEKLAELSDLQNNTRGAADGYARNYDPTDGGFFYRVQVEQRGEREELLQQRDQLATNGRNQWSGYVPSALVDDSESMKVQLGKSIVPAGLDEKTAEDDAVSTFSLHVSDVSFKLARAALARGEWPEAAKVRIEEFVNAFDYGDPLPSRREKVSCQLEQSIHPFLQQRNLVRISMRTAAAGRSSDTPLRLTFVLDNSGSMERIDRRQIVRRAFALLVQQLKPIDQVTLISFARQPRLLADKVGGAESHQLVELIAGLPSQGGTNIEAALQLAFEKAKEQQVAGAQNRIILLTDGAVNLGDANPESLSQMITTMRDTGIAVDAAGVSAEGLNDEVLEALTRRGDGRYYLLDSLEAADDGFARQIAGALRPSAKNVKVQIEFNPQRVGRYKLLGFEKHRLKQEDFRDDKVDAAEMAAEEAGVAMYQFEAKPDGEGDVGSVSVRFRDLSTGEMVENCWPIPYEAAAPRPEQAAPSLRIATSAAMLAARLRGDPLGETVNLQTLSDLMAGLPDRERSAERVQQLRQMIQQARQVSGE